MLPTSMVKPVLEEMYELRREMVPCFIGDPGIGKTQGIYEFAKEKGINVVTFILSNTVPSEVSGIRMPDKETKKMEVFDDMRMASLRDGDILFFDEILEAPPMLWSACLTLIQDRIMASGRRLPDVFIVAASNKVASPTIIPASTRDRFQFIELEFDRYHWSEWFFKKYGVRPSNTILERIQGDSSSYNILTPRRVTKLYEWFKLSVNDKKISIAKSMFDAVIVDCIIEMVYQVPTPQEQIVHALDVAGIKLPDEYEKLSLKEVFDALQALPNWDKIAEVLSSTEIIEPEKTGVKF